MGGVGDMGLPREEGLTESVREVLEVSASGGS
jgi:hypothetical protein